MSVETGEKASGRGAVTASELEQHRQIGLQNGAVAKERSEAPVVGQPNVRQLPAWLRQASVADRLNAGLLAANIAMLTVTLGTLVATAGGLVVLKKQVDIMGAQFDADMRPYLAPAADTTAIFDLREDGSGALADTTRNVTFDVQLHNVGRTPLRFHLTDAGFNGLAALENPASAVLFPGLSVHAFIRVIIPETPLTKLSGQVGTFRFEYAPPPLFLLPLVLAACRGKTATWTGGSHPVSTDPGSCAGSCCNVGDQPPGCTGGPLTEAQCVGLRNRALAETTCSDEEKRMTGVYRRPPDAGSGASVGGRALSRAAVRLRHGWQDGVCRLGTRRRGRGPHRQPYRGRRRVHGASLPAGSQGRAIERAR